MMSASSSLSPEFDRARIASSTPIIPRSPWLASAGWTNCAGVPVEARVAAILRAMWPLLPMPVTIRRPRAAAHRSSAMPKPASRVRESCSRPSISAQMTRRATARSRARPLPSRLAARPLNALSSKAAMVLSPKTSPPLMVRPETPRPCPPHTPETALMREDVLLRPAGQIKQGACRQEIKAAAGQVGAPLARQHRVESRPQRVQVQHVRGGIAQLLFGQRRRPPVRALLLLLQIDAEQVLAQIPEPMPVGKRADQPRGDLGAIERLGHHPEVAVDDGDIEPREMEQLDDRWIDQQPLEVRRVVAAGGELHQVRIAIATRQLDQAKPIAMRVEPHRLGVDRHRVAEP